MSEQIKVDYRDLAMMSADALGFFTDEIKQGNNVLVLKEGKDIEIKSVRDWDTLLISAGGAKKPEKKNYRI